MMRLILRLRAAGRHLLVIWHAWRDPALKWPGRLVLIAIALYLLSPVDLVPDWLPVLGWLDDLALPDLPVVWDRRVIDYLLFYKDDPRGRRLMRAWLERPAGFYYATGLMLVIAAIMLGFAALELSPRFGKLEFDRRLARYLASIPDGDVESRDDSLWHAMFSQAKPSAAAILGSQRLFDPAALRAIAVFATAVVELDTQAIRLAFTSTKLPMCTSSAAAARCR